MKRILRALLGAIFIASYATSCTTVDKTSGMKRISDDFFLASGVAKYFLPDVPNWLNRSESAGCLRDESFYRFNMQALRQSYGLSYLESVQFQLSFNLSSTEALERSQQAGLPLKEMEALFHLTMDRIRAQIFALNLPTFKRVHMVWIDDAMRDAQSLSSLRTLMSSEDMELGHPVFVSLCSSYRKVQQFLTENKLADKNIRILPAEIFHSYDPEMNLLPYDRIFTDQVFLKEQKIIFYSPKPSHLLEVQGAVEFKNY